MSKAQTVRAGLLVTAAALVAWVRLLPLSLGALDEQATQEARQEVARRVGGDEPHARSESERRVEIQRRVEQWIDHNRAQFERTRDEWAARLKSELSYRGSDGRDYVYLGDYDSYTWLRHARNYLRTGTTCDAVVDGECRDTYANAPVGRRDQYHRSLHIAAIVGLHRLITFFNPHYPLPASSFLVPVVVGVLGVFPAFAIGQRLGGDVAGWCAAVLIGVNPIFLQRSMGSDSDVWNVVLPLFMIWAGTTALSAAGLGRRLLFGVLAAAFAALHAATWRGWVFTYDVLLVGLLGNAVVLALRHVIRTGSARAWQDREVRHAMLVFVLFSVATGLLTLLAGAEESYLRITVRPVAAILQGSLALDPPAATPMPIWPDVLSTVAELRRPNLASIAAFMSGTLFFFVGWLGLLVLLLPRHGWQWWHFVILIGGNYLYRYLLTAAELSRSVLVGLLAVPLAVAVVLYAFADEGAAEADQGVALTVVLWFLAALFLSFSGLRFVMLLVPPFAITCAVALGRLHGWLDARAAAIHVRHARLASPVLFVIFAALLVRPVYRGSIAARGYLPRINDAWWDTLTKIRDETPSTALVNTWWDYGYWVKYIAERRVSADGGSLLTHIPHWLARALIAADERETIGLLRMLNCGSDATPEPEGRAGAYGRLVAHGISAVAAHSMVVELADLDQTEGRAYLAANGLPERAATEVLTASHCTPPPAYLVLSTEMINQRAWRLLGTWDPAKGDAGALSSGYLTTRWRRCQQRTAGKEMLCPVDVTIDRTGTKIESVVYVADLPSTTRLHFRRAPHNESSGDEFDRTPELVLWATETGMESISLPSPTHPDIAVLVDVSKERVLLGPPRLLRSTFTHLVYLDGRYVRYFEKFDERTGYNSERLVTWKIDWEGRQSLPP